jgi:tetratricopeptide (TPR) repeat protein
MNMGEQTGAIAAVDAWHAHIQHDCWPWIGSNCARKREMKTTLNQVGLVVLLLAAGGTSGVRGDAPRELEHPLAPYAETKAVRLEGMGRYGRTVSTSNPEAQQYFNQGLVLTYGFNHDEAIRSFAECAKLDPDCAMAYWGIAYALGPNFNLKMDEANGKRAYAALREALAGRGNASEVERGLIEALEARYAYPPPAERDHLELAFSQAMGRLWQKFPRDPDVGYIYAESMMNKHPWDQWERDGRPKRDTLEVVRVLEEVLALDINHPGANHMLVHALEGSQMPERAEAAADRLGRITPGIGHMVHMPSHIYMRVGRYRDSLECNRRASLLDKEYFAKVGPQGVYHVYHVHNDHFLVWTAMFMGRYEDALKSADDMLVHLPEPFQAMPDFAPFLVSRLKVFVRFGRWDEILQFPRPREDQPYCVAIWHYARGIAYANRFEIDKARAEAAEFEKHAALVPEAEIATGISGREIMGVAREMLAGETAFKAGEHDIAFKHLRAAVKAELALRYTEPNPWMVPARHALGALLLARGELAEAEQVYRDDLRWYPGNGWALRGLAECLERTGRGSEAAKVRHQFQKAWADATVSIEASCFCGVGS